MEVVMKKNPKTTKHGLVIAAALLAGGASLAVLYLSQTADAAPRQPLVYYQAVSEWRNHVPYETSNTSYGLYQQFVLPDGTVTGPIGPHANGG
jgi:hypothetical protein